MHYIFMASFLWMSAEGHHLYRLVVVVFKTDTQYSQIYPVICYGLPIVIVGITEIIGGFLEQEAYGRDEM